MKNFIAKKPSGHDQMSETEPSYMMFIPRQNGPYYLVIEIHNLETEKIRLVSLKSKEEMEIFLNLFNLISSYRSYEAKIINDGRDKESGPEFFPRWVRTYTEHKGIMTFTAEILSRKNLEYLVYFGDNNPAIKGLIFNE